MVREVLFFIFAGLALSGVIGSILRIGEPKKAETPGSAAVYVVIALVSTYLYYVMWKGHF